MERRPETGTEDAVLGMLLGFLWTTFFLSSLQTLQTELESVQLCGKRFFCVVLLCNAGRFESILTSFEQSTIDPYSVSLQFNNYLFANILNRDVPNFPTVSCALP